MSLGSEAQKYDVKYFADSNFYQLDTLEYTIPSKSSDSSFLQLQLIQQVRRLREQAYLAANLDSIIVRNDSLIHVHFYLGSQLVYGDIQWKGLKKEYLNNPILRKFDLSGQQVNRENIKIISDAIIRELDDDGYPLAKIRFTNKRIRNDSLFSDVIIEPGKRIYFGTLNDGKDSIVSPQFLSRYLDIRDGELFKLSKINNINQQLNQLAYMRLDKTPEVKIIGSKAYIDVPLKKVPSSRFDFLIGVLPNVENEDRFTISGELTADFKNKFKQGETFFLHFQQLRPETQKIQINVQYPYLLNLPFGVHGAFSLYRNGTESRDLNSELGIQYRSGNSLESKFFVNIQSSRLIAIDSLSIINSRQLPASLDVRLNNLGARFTSNKLDYRFNPSKGYFAELSMSAGIKTILPNNQIRELRNQSVDFSTAYDSLDLSVFQFNTEILAEYFIPLRSSSTIKLMNSSGIKWNQKKVFFNEYYRIGGSNILRGFDEESIRAQYYSVFTAEFRYLLSLNSYFSTFVDYALVYNEFDTSRKWDQPLGFGIGLSFQTNAGIFGIDVALGREKGNAFDFRNAKTHFGFISLF